MNSLLKCGLALKVLRVKINNVNNPPTNSLILGSYKEIIIN